jgi:hypothetical protein
LDRKVIEAAASSIPSPTFRDCRKIASPAPADVSAGANRERPPRDLLLQVTRRVRVLVDCKDRLALLKL